MNSLITPKHQSYVNLSLSKKGCSTPVQKWIIFRRKKSLSKKQFRSRKVTKGVPNTSAKQFQIDLRWLDWSLSAKKTILEVDFEKALPLTKSLGFFNVTSFSPSSWAVDSRISPAGSMARSTEVSFASNSEIP